MAIEFQLDVDEPLEGDEADRDDNDDGRLRRRFERWDDMTDEYRKAAGRIASFQALAEIVGVLMYDKWAAMAPDFTRKQMMVAKIQDEVGHGHVMARVAEDLGVSRERIIGDFLEGRTKLLSIFHYDLGSWEEVGPAALLQNSAAIVQFNALEKGTYLPYVRALKKIEREEGFHYHHAWDLAHEIITEGTAEQRRLAQQAFETWVPRILSYFGPSDTATYKANRMYQLGLKVESNDALRQRWLAKIIPVFAEMGYHVPYDMAHYDEELGEWVCAPPDWAEMERVLVEGGPAFGGYVDSIRSSMDRNADFRRAALRVGEVDLRGAGRSGALVEA